MKNRIRISLIIVCATVFAIIYCNSLVLEDVYIYNLWADIFSLAIVLIMLVQYRGKGCFEPIYFITAIYAVMFFVTPIYDILTGDFDWYGYYLFEYGIKTTFMALAGYFVFYVLYVKSFTFGHNWNYIKKEKRKVVSQKYTVPVIIIMYVVCFAANAYYLLHSGYGSLLYILSLGLLDNSSSSYTTYSNIGFISMLSYSLPTVVLLYWEFGNSRFLKWVLFVPMLMMQVARGFRFFVIQIVITFVCYYFIRKNKKVKIVHLVTILGAMMIFVLLMTTFRVAIRSGVGIDTSIINGDMIKDSFDSAFWDNLRIYKNVYGMVPVIPSQYDYVWGRQIVIGTIVMMIPRALWPGKISSYGGEGLTTLIGPNIASGQAYPALGEYYYAAGFFGILFFMGLYGHWAKELKNKYMNNVNSLDLIYFSVLLGCNLQLIIRGYFPSNFWYLVFAILPIWVVRKLFVKEVASE
ncbi:O-antigen polysaccharide polymerase Wzy [Blautia glucerasea]|uniref:O-antigen polysaccharide polymerase Wzy n=1 Tax=Blautia glucerasea TaxID=536633 RepID=UPI001D0790FC|nr:O-antigen polysaccharide polymerase Wzy [Blautia glucerasea]MCB6545902.1 O-antigen polysaccharide polymerase Wzy family protein [Blautia glucerasea]